MVGLGDPAVANCLYVDCHDPEALAGMGSAEQRAGWSTGDLAADDHPVARDEYFVYLKLQVGDRCRKATNDLDGGFAPPAFARQVTGAGLVVRCQTLFLQLSHVSLDGQIEQPVPGLNNGSRLFFGHGRRPREPSTNDAERGSDGDQPSGPTSPGCPAMYANFEETDVPHGSLPVTMMILIHANYDDHHSQEFANG